MEWFWPFHWSDLQTRLHPVLLDDSCEARRNMVRRKTAEYLVYAEDLHKSRLDASGNDAQRWRQGSALPRCVAKLRTGLTELSQYKVWVLPFLFITPSLIITPAVHNKLTCGHSYRLIHNFIPIDKVACISYNFQAKFRVIWQGQYCGWADLYTIHGMKFSPRALPTKDTYWLSGL